MIQFGLRRRYSRCSLPYLPSRHQFGIVSRNPDIYRFPVADSSYIRSPASLMLLRSNGISSNWYRFWKQYYLLFVRDAATRSKHSSKAVASDYCLGVDVQLYAVVGNIRNYQLTQPRAVVYTSHFTLALKSSELLLKTRNSIW